MEDQKKLCSVAVIMGSDSDWPTMKKAVETLKEYGVGFEVCVASAHRTPEAVLDYAEKARTRGIRVLIAGAGAAAHLAGVVAAKTTLPVVAVPIDATPLRGVDALYAMVQMPSGIPVATVAINGAKNAALLAIEILSVADEQLAQALDASRREMARQVEEKNRKIQQLLEDI